MSTRIPTILYPQCPAGIRLPKYRYHAASGRAVIQYKPIWGKNPHYLKGAYGSPESIADYYRCCERIVRHKLRSQLPKTRRPAAKPLSVMRFLEQFFAWAQQHYDPTDDSQQKELSHLKRAAKPLYRRYGNRPMRRIGPVRLKRVRADMVKSGSSRSHINAQFNRLKRIIAWGVENELLPAKQLHAIKAIKSLRKGKTKAPDKEPVMPIDWATASRVLPYVAPNVAAAIEVQYLTGMRSSELTSMTPAQIDFREDVWIYRPTRHKTAHLGKPKAICLGPRAQELLIPYLARIGLDDYVFSPRISMRELFERRAGARRSKRYKPSRFNPYRYRARYKTDTFWQAVAHGFDALDKAQEKEHGKAFTPIERWNPHRLRHTRATLTREKYGLEGGQTQLGNTLQATEIYAEKNLLLGIRIAVETG